MQHRGTENGSTEDIEKKLPLEFAMDDPREA
jgi:hypothetical protein